MVAVGIVQAMTNKQTSLTKWLVVNQLMLWVLRCDWSQGIPLGLRKSSAHCSVKGDALHKTVLANNNCPPVLQSHLASWYLVVILVRERQKGLR